ncbi:MAG: RadC family protein [Eubacterium sp.]|nr:RadC family protein [Eubacterium sp.]
MEELSRKGHRQRLKDAYLKSGLDSMPDHNVLELILFYAIPQKDVKPLAYELINHFGSLENVINADIKELMLVNGVKEHTAILISLFKGVNLRVNQNCAKEKYRSFESIAKYSSMMLRSYTNEVIMIVTFDNNNSIINTHIRDGGTVNRAQISKKDIAEIALRDNASSLAIAHNHPGGNTNPSVADINMTQELSVFLRQLNVRLIDHVIVGEGGKTESIKSNSKYIKFFD